MALNLHEARQHWLLAVQNQRSTASVEPHLEAMEACLREGGLNLSHLDITQDDVNGVRERNRDRATKLDDEPGTIGSFFGGKY